MLELTKGREYNNKLGTLTGGRRRGWGVTAIALWVGTTRCIFGGDIIGWDWS